MQINLGAKKIHCKIVYYGPGYSGKTTNIQKVHDNSPEDRKSQLTSIATEGDRTLFFDFMSLDLGQVMGMDTCFQLYTVPGQVYYGATRKLVLQGVDGLVFVADSSPEQLEANVESWADLVKNLTEYGLTLDDIPVVIQFNKRDVPGAIPTEQLNDLINEKGFETFEAVACEGTGVLQTLKAICSKVFKNLSSKTVEQKALRSAPVATPLAPSPAAYRPVSSPEVPQAEPPVRPLPRTAVAAVATSVAEPRPQRIATIALDNPPRSANVGTAARPRTGVQDFTKKSTAQPRSVPPARTIPATPSVKVVKSNTVPGVIGVVKPKRDGSGTAWLAIAGMLIAAAAVAIWVVMLK